MRSDGRHARQVKNKEQLTKTLIDYIRVHGDIPTADVLAEHAEVSRRSVFRLFENRTDLLRTTSEYMYRELQRDLPSPDFTGTAPEAVMKQIVDYLGAVYEYVAPLRRVLDRKVADTSLIELERERIQSIFEVPLQNAFSLVVPDKALDSPVTRETFRLVLSWKAWDHLRGDRKLSMDHAKAVMLHALTILLRDAGAEVD